MAEYPHIGRMFGIELEFFLLDHEGKVSNKADRIINSLKDKLTDSEIKQECGESMLELTSFPHMSSREVFGKFFSDFEQFLYELETNDMKPYYYGTYPGKNLNRMRKDERYNIKSRILGEKQFQYAGKCIGFHCHYSLPRNVFNPKTNYFYPDLEQRKKDKITNLFNLDVALDPAITTLMQSSPYVESKLMGKDGRVIVYRGDKNFGFPDSLYNMQPEFGNLNEYATDFEEMLGRITDRTGLWKQLLKKENAKWSDFAKKEVSLLDSSWKPVKISPHATIESRGADMNSLPHVVGLSRIIKILSKHVQNNALTIVPSEIGEKEPFKMEENKIYVPRFKKLKELEYNAAIKGFEDKEVFEYSSSLIELVKKITAIETQAPLRVFSKMLDEKKTVSDRIIEFVRKKQGYTETIEEDTARDFALRSSEKIFKDLLITKTMCEVSLIF